MGAPKAIDSSNAWIVGSRASYTFNKPGGSCVDVFLEEPGLCKLWQAGKTLQANDGLALNLEEKREQTENILEVLLDLISWSG